MRIWMDAQRGRWRVAAVLTGLAVALFLGACEVEAGSDGKGGPLSEDELASLVAEVGPADRFALLAISVDGKLETATDFMENESMPFAHWYVGMQSDVARILNVSAFPTYILLDEQGKIVARGNALPGTFLTLIEETVEAASEA